LIRLRRFALSSLIATVVALGLAPLAAEATTTQTVHLDGVPIDIGATPCFPGDLWVTGNAVMHQTINNAGDVWVTATIEGSAVDAVAGFTGHATVWFGFGQNNKSGVNHFTANVIGTLTDGTRVRIHGEGQMTVNAQGNLVVNRTTFTCS
jgi:hypothetical protein